MLHLCDRRLEWDSACVTFHWDANLMASACWNERKTDFPHPLVHVNWRNVPEDLLHDSWFLRLTRNSKRLQRVWAGGLVKRLLRRQLLRSEWCFLLTASPVRRASPRSLRQLRLDSILGKKQGAGGGLGAEPGEATVGCQPAPHWSWKQVTCGCFPGQKWVLLERVPYEDILSPAQKNHLRGRMMLSKKWL